MLWPSEINSFTTGLNILHGPHHDAEKYFAVFIEYKYVLTNKKVAEDVGFEPTEPVRVQWFSRPPP